MLHYSINSLLLKKNNSIFVWTQLLGLNARQLGGVQLWWMGHRQCCLGAYLQSAYNCWEPTYLQQAERLSCGLLWAICFGACPPAIVQQILNKDSKQRGGTFFRATNQEFTLWSRSQTSSLFMVSIASIKSRRERGVGTRLHCVR